MFIVADCGTTKCDWALVDQPGLNFFTGQGFNPLRTVPEEIMMAIATAMDANGVDTSKAEEVFFYGAGCIPEVSDGKIKQILSTLMPQAKINVESDLMAAARAVFKHDNGIIGILGTGSNSGVYNSGKITEHIPPLGYIIGDEGSGAAIGKRLINAIYKNELPNNYREMFEQECNTYYNDIIQNVYSSPTPAKYLSEFVPFVKNHIDDTMMRNLVFCEFEKYFTRNIIRYNKFKTMDTGFVGSVAKEFKDILSDAARFHGVSIVSVIQKPIERLVEYHVSSGETS